MDGPIYDAATLAVGRLLKNSMLAGPWRAATTHAAWRAGPDIEWTR